MNSPGTLLKLSRRFKARTIGVSLNLLALICSCASRRSSKGQSKTVVALTLATRYISECLLWVKFGRSTPPARMAAYPPIAAVMDGSSDSQH